MKRVIVFILAASCFWACSQSAEELCNKGIAYYDGTDGVEQDKAKGITLLKKSAEKGYSNAYYLLGVIAMGEGNVQDCLTYFDKALELGEPTNARMLGNNFYYGQDSFPEDDACAAKYYLKAVDLGVADSEVFLNLGTLFYNGDGVDLDYGKAATCFQRAADMNEPKALYNLAICYYNGLGVEMNQDMAIECIKRSAELGNEKAQNYLNALRQEEYERQQAMQAAMENQIIACPLCEGTGYILNGAQICSVCRGSGQVRYGYARSYGLVN